jgi:hypothetical protein|tara:strand:+ start:43 stop:306 length:264 start_codon:yes stop_codon:yes gene_type:complete
MLQFKQHLAEAWKRSKLSPKQDKLIDKKKYIITQTVVQGNDAIVKVQGRLDSGIIYLMIKDDKLVMSSQGNALQLDNLKGAKFKLEN